VCFDKIDYCSSTKNLSEIEDAPNFKFVKGNLLSADLIKYVLETEKVDTIIHAAAQTHVDNSFGNSFAFTENNVMGTHVLIETAKNVGIKRFIHVSTDEVYGSSYDGEERHVESDVLEPTNPYAATKAAAENIVKSYFYSYKMPVIITRGNNVYGPHQYPEKIVPKFIRRLMKGEPCCLHGDGTNSRHFIYVEDVANAFITILHKGIDGDTYNVGCEEECTNLEIAEKLVLSVMPGSQVCALSAREAGPPARTTHARAPRAPTRSRHVPTTRAHARRWSRALPSCSPSPPPRSPRTISSLWPTAPSTTCDTTSPPRS